MNQNASGGQRRTVESQQPTKRPRLERRQRALKMVADPLSRPWKLLEAYVLLIVLALLSACTSTSESHAGGAPVGEESGALTLTSSEKFVGEGSFQTRGVWELSSLSVPPNTAGCDANGAVLTYGENSTGIWKGSLACFRNNTQTACPMTEIHLPATVTYERAGVPHTFKVSFGASDARMARLANGELLISTQGIAYSPGRFERRGGEGFFSSRDCGTTWSLRSVLDPKYDVPQRYYSPAFQAGLDYPTLATDPWRGTIYFMAKSSGAGDFVAGGPDRAPILFVSKDGARTWSPVVSNGASVFPWETRFAITALPTGQAVLFTCLQGLAPKVWVYDSNTNTLGPEQVLTAAPVCDWLVDDHSESIARAFIGGQNRVRMLYPIVLPAGDGFTRRQRLRLLEHAIDATGTVSAAFTMWSLGPGQSNGSAVFGQIIDTDYFEVSRTNTGNAALVYWLETTTTDTAANPNPKRPTSAAWGTVTPRAADVTTSGPGTSFALGQGWQGLGYPGDYVVGSSFYDRSTSEVGFFAHYTASPVTAPGSAAPLKARVVTWQAPSTQPSCELPELNAICGSNSCCSADCPCPEGRGDCTGTASCAPGLVCGTNNGAEFGALSSKDICVRPACSPNPKAPWDNEFCSSACPCGARMGDCDSNGECLPGLVCARNVGGQFNKGKDFDVCLPLHCIDGVQNAGETGVDFGGACSAPGAPTPPSSGPWAGYCGPSARCADGLGSCEHETGCNEPGLQCVDGICSPRTGRFNGTDVYCTSGRRCTHGQGFCQISNPFCAAGLVCSSRVALYGMSDPDLMNSGDTSVGVCIPAACDTARVPGASDFCSITCKCARGFGACESNSECLPGLSCTQYQGTAFGFAPSVNICLPSHCSDGVLNEDEQLKDCGGRDCGACELPIPRPFTASRFVDTHADYNSYQPTTMHWFETLESGIVRTTPMMWFGVTPQYGDYDGNGTADLGYKAALGGHGFYTPGSGTPMTNSPATGIMSSDVPVPGWYDLGPTSDVVWWRPSNGTWYLKEFDTGASIIDPVQWGQVGDIPVPGDYDGDSGKRYDFAIYRPNRTLNRSEWWILSRTTLQLIGAAPIIWGMPDDIPVPGDYDGDGTSDLVVFRWERTSSGNAQLATWFGQRTDGTSLFSPVQAADEPAGWYKYRVGDIPVAGDFDGDRRSDLAVFRPSTSQWIIRAAPGNPPFLRLFQGREVPYIPIAPRQPPP